MNHSLAYIVIIVLCLIALMLFYSPFRKSILRFFARKPYLPPQSEWPKAGYYYHYKHDPSGTFNNYAYYIYGVGHHTEDDCRPEDKHTIVYRPLYEAYVFKNGKMFDVRPLHMFFEPAEWQGKQVKRFVRITDQALITKLEILRVKMYSDMHFGE